MAGSTGTWTVRFTVGPYGIDDGGGIKLLWVIPSDRGVPQFERPADPEYATVSTDGAAGVFPRWETKAHVRPWAKGIVLDVTDGALAPGDHVDVVLGDRSGGSPGATLQSYVELGAQVRVMVDPFATGIYYDVPGSTSMDVVAGVAERLLVTARQALPGRSASVSIRAIDRYGNLARTYRGRLSVALDRDGERVDLGECAIGADDAGIRTLETDLPAGSRVEVTSEEGWSAVSNPVPGAVGGTGRLLLWGDTQGQTGETVGAGSLDEFFEYARDTVQLDFVTHSANDFQVDNAAYAESLAKCDSFTADGTFVAFGGFEWSGNTPVGGDHNVLYADTSKAPLLRSSHALVDDHSDLDTDAPTVSDLYRAIREGGLEAVCVPHVGGRRAKPEMIDPELSPILEIVSVHGWFEWFLLDALRLGKVVGVVGASDDHSGRPGGSFPSLPLFGVRSGLAAVYAEDLSRRGIQRAMKARHTYATTGERMVLDVSTADGEHVMGDRWAAAEAPSIAVYVDGTAPIEAIEVLGAEGVLQRWTPELEQSDTEIRVSWRGARDRDRRRVQDWAGGLTVGGARVEQVRAWSFDHPDHEVVHTSAHQVEWTSTTNGDSDGVELRLDQAPTHFEFAAGGVELTIQMEEVGADGLEVPVDSGVDRAVCVRRLPSTEPASTARVEFSGLPIHSGLNPYVIKVHQSDGHLAWSSPMFVDN